MIQLIAIISLLAVVSCEEKEGSEQQNANISSALIITLLLLFFNKFLHKKIEKLKKRFGFLEFIQPTLITMTLGILAGLILHFLKIKAVGSTIKIIFEPIFMIVLLPPILYSSVLTMEKYYFFKNIGAILMLAFLGTLLAIFTHWILLFLL